MESIYTVAAVIGIGLVVIITFSISQKLLEKRLEKRYNTKIEQIIEFQKKWLEKKEEQE